MHIEREFIKINAESETYTVPLYHENSPQLPDLIIPLTKKTMRLQVGDKQMVIDVSDPARIPLANEIDQLSIILHNVRKAVANAQLLPAEVAKQLSDFSKQINQMADIAFIGPIKEQVQNELQQYLDSFGAPDTDSNILESLRTVALRRSGVMPIDAAPVHTNGADIVSVRRDIIPDRHRGRSAVRDSMMYRVTDYVMKFGDGASRAIAHYVKPKLAIPRQLVVAVRQAAWDSEVKLHPATRRPIFTFRVFQAGIEIGSAAFYNHPLLCKSADGSQNNILSMTGLFDSDIFRAQLRVATPALENVCAALPPTVGEQMVAAGWQAAGLGTIGGAANVFGYTLKINGFSEHACTFARGALYYGTVFSWQFNQHYQALGPAADSVSEAQRLTTAAYQAAYDTGSLAVVQIGLSYASRLAGWAERKTAESGWNKTSRFFGWVKKTVPFGSYAYQSYQQGVSVASGSVAAGAGTEIGVTAVGKAGVYCAVKSKKLISARLFSGSERAASSSVVEVSSEKKEKRF